MTRLVPPLRIGSLAVDPPLVLAPMAGITDRHFRLALRRVGGVGLVSMEFISSEAITRGIRPILAKMVFDPAERPLSIQVYGRDPARMADAAAMVEDLGADACDINMGCPAQKVLRGFSGAALMGDLDRAARIVEACRKRVSIPLTVKMRLGLGRGERPETFRELARACRDLGVDAVALHARTARQGYTGRADWSRIRELVEMLDIPVIGNGDVRTAGDAVRMFRETGCAGVMIGRGVLLDPFVFRSAAAALAGREPVPPTPEERHAFVRDLFERIIAAEEPRVALHKLRTLAGKFTHGMPGGRALRRRINDLREPADFLAALDDHFAVHAPGEARRAAAGPAVADVDLPSAPEARR